MTKPHHVRRALLIAPTIVAALVAGCTVYLTSKLCRGGADRHGDFADAAGQSGIIVCFYMVGLPLAKANSETEGML